MAARLADWLVPLLLVVAAHTCGAAACHAHAVANPPRPGTLQSPPLTPQVVPVLLQALLAWVGRHGVVPLLLRSNLHVAQYAEQAQRVLSYLVQVRRHRSNATCTAARPM